MWRFNSMMVTLGWRLVNLGHWIVKTFARTNCATSSIDGAAQAAAWRPEENAFIHFADID